MSEARLFCVLAGVAILLAGCTSAPPPAQPPPGPTKVVLTATEQSPAPGSTVHLAWEVQGGTEGISHSELHWGSASLADPTQGVYPSTSPGTAVGAGRYTGTLTMPASGPLFVRAHVTAPGNNLWSAEVALQAPVGVRFTGVEIPPDVEAGVSFNITYRAEGTGTTTHIGAHFSTVSSASLGEHVAPAEWPGARASQHLGSPSAVQLPRDLTVSATLPSPGTWYVRPHALVGTESWWGAEVQVRAGDPNVPNIQLLTAPTSGVAGDPVTIDFQVNSQPVTSTHVGAHYSMNSSGSLAAGFLPTDWAGARKAP
ncbi:MAG TPA: hypothetical protein VGR28_15510, partial [Candidatus Thermoplasmatota archaeon]|nr:hypothetical protein [Candidatus Thermoplasmatota archaeon]